MYDVESIKKSRIPIDAEIKTKFEEYGYPVLGNKELSDRAYDLMISRYDMSMQRFLIRKFEIPLLESILFLNNWNVERENELSDNAISKYNLNDLINNINKIVSEIDDKFNVLKLTDVFYSETYLTENHVKTFRTIYAGIRETYNQLLKNPFLYTDNEVQKELKTLFNSLINLVETEGYNVLKQSSEVFNEFYRHYVTVIGKYAEVSPVIYNFNKLYYLDSEYLANIVSNKKIISLPIVDSIKNYIKKNFDRKYSFDPSIPLVLGSPGIGKTQMIALFMNKLEQDMRTNLNKIDTFLVSQGIDIDKLTIDKIRDLKNKYLEQLHSESNKENKEKNIVKIINYLTVYSSIYKNLTDPAYREEIRENFIELFIKKTDAKYRNFVLPSEHPTGIGGLAATKTVADNIKSVDVIFDRTKFGLTNIDPESISIMVYDEAGNVADSVFEVFKSIATDMAVGGSRADMMSFVCMLSNIGKLDQTKSNIERLVLQAQEQKRRFYTLVLAPTKEDFLTYCEDINKKIQKENDIRSKLYDEDRYYEYNAPMIDRSVIEFLEQFGDIWLNSKPAYSTSSSDSSVSSSYTISAGTVTPANWEAFGLYINTERMKYEGKIFEEISKKPNISQKEQLDVRNKHRDVFFENVRKQSIRYFGNTYLQFMSFFEHREMGADKVAYYFEKNGIYDRFLKQVDNKINTKNFNSLVNEINKFLFTVDNDAEDQEKQIEKQNNLFVYINSTIYYATNCINKFGALNNADASVNKKELLKELIGILAFVESLSKHDKFGMIVKLEKNMRENPNFEEFKKVSTELLTKLVSQNTDAQKKQSYEVLDMLTKNYNLVNSKDNVLNFENE